MNLTDDTCYTALQARDARFDGVFFTGVKSTGIYCRPVCPARTPAAKSCAFYPTASAAEAAGFRPCLRCRPELAPGCHGSSLAEAILSRLQERAVEGVWLADLDADLGLSTRQVRRILEAEYGVTPVQVIQTQRLLLAKQLLQETSQPVSEIALAAGFRSLRNFNALFQQRYGLVPSACRRKVSSGSDGIRLRLAYRAPLAWTALMDYFRSRLVPGVEEICGAEYRRTVTLGEATGWMRVWPTEGAAVLNVEVSPSLMRHLGAVQARVRRMFDLDARPDAIESVLKADPLLAPVFADFPGLRVGGAWDTFELAVRAVLGQQITVVAATTLSGRLAARIGSKIETPFPNLHRHAIQAAALDILTVEEMCQLGLVRARAETLKHLASFALQGGLQFPPGLDHESAVAQLVELPGIGPWTAHYIAMRALRFPDAFPAADLGLRKAIGQGVLIPTKQAEQRSLDWRPWRAYAAAALWKSLTP
ncbi:DNA-3-methyladenine glycosylase 2 [Prosthecobacter dejongeii]|uniref:DNA-3-methyladenine glycosylase II n=1 Tax=Prosthecobacter dejongeii TaxID=48465 RepID=A0A7W7YPW0_9BACT|nr:DNA-3-methyladenine glycosylase 2 [Prosthecobacter dejongeii]MBB5040064.1 AraC family transcriptional regulator of adaptative response / DNA-3-methyladenine glycosylase II [Prosthecobacter dejongeii]